jgi:exopolysaccharide biosynthesis polyprenyl glycosylphosphotransferase
VSTFQQTDSPPRNGRVSTTEVRDVRRKRPPALSFILRMETLRRLCRVASLLVLDYLGVAGAITSAMWLKSLIDGKPSLTLARNSASPYIAFAFLVTVLLFARADLYSDRNRRPGLSKIATALFQATVISLIFALASGHQFSSYYLFYGSLAIGAVYIGALRHVHTLVTGWLLARAGYRRKALVVGSGEQIDAVAHALATGGRDQLELVGCVSLTPRPDNGLRSLGTLADLPEILASQEVHEVILAAPDFPGDQAVELVDECHQRGISVQVAPSTMEILIERAEFVPGALLPLFRVRPLVFEGVDYALKRAFDLTLATFALILLAPVLAVIALAVKLTSRGPVLYRSLRPGIAGTPFHCLKFRTMHEGAEEIQEILESLNEKNGALFKIRDDPRITGLGRFLRKFSLDELPQLINVLRGEMSLVGPRPLPLRDYELLADWHRKRNLVLPGITGLWQISGRADLDFDDLVRLDFLYLEQWSIALDLSILLKTIPAVLSRKGAY